MSPGTAQLRGNCPKGKKTGAVPLLSDRPAGGCSHFLLKASLVGLRDSELESIHQGCVYWRVEREKEVQD